MSDAMLITFPPSLDSELSRFLLTHYRIPHQEQRHVIIFSSLYSLWHGYTVRFPFLYSDSYRLNTVRKIFEHFEPLSPDERKLLPPGADAAKAEDDWTLFNSRLGTATSVFGYYHLLPHRQLMVHALSGGAPSFEVSAVRGAYPVFAGLLRLLLRLEGGRAQEALAEIRAVMRIVDERLGDGRQYLLGERFSLSDMAFAVAAAPVLFPDNYGDGDTLPPLSESPPEIQNLVEELRRKPSGQLALRIYRERRTPGSQS
ncbi:MAG TPA: glutathione S-transferase C-terminal domain-containing protein [Pyrinomonadaceae bacterium]|nr:glutathione S-transferase C-terminal domain-containing protein [Pyrinomonadaceae bacterium]